MKPRATYLDYNATAPIRPAALAFVSDIMTMPHNASAVHGYGRAGRKIIEAARAQVAALVGAPPAQVVFNSGATEGNNTVLKHFAGERILVSAIEHPSVLEAAPAAEKIPVTQDGVIDLDALAAMLKIGRTAVVSIMLVNNETGVIQPIEQAAALAKNHGALVHCDAVQAAGRIAVDIAALGVDFMTLSAHKIGGPQGAGALVFGLCGETPVLLHGGGQEKQARAGTENVAAIGGFGVAAQEAQKDMAQYQALAAMRDALEKRIAAIAPDTVFHGAKAPRVAGTSMFSLPGRHSETMLIGLDLGGVAVSNGSACSSGTVRASAVLRAMGCGDTLASSALRVSMGWNTSPQDVEIFACALEKILKRTGL